MSGTIFKLKNSAVTAAPADDALLAAEPAYSFASDKLFIGLDNNGTIEAVEIGGQYYVQMLDHTAGQLTASSAIVVDANKHIDEIIAGGLTLTTSGGAGVKVTSIVDNSTGIASDVASASDAKLLTEKAIRAAITAAQNVSELSDLSDITVATPASAQVLVYSAGDSEFKNVALSGDVTIAENGAVTLANSGVTAGTYGSATAVPQITVDAKGRITEVTAIDIQTSLSLAGDNTTTGSVDQDAGDSLTFAGGTGLTGTVSGTTVTFKLDDTAVTAGSYGSASKSLSVTVDAQGRLTSAAEQDIQIATSQITNLDEAIEDLAAGLFTNATHSGITATYTDVPATGESPNVATVDQQGRITAVGEATVDTSLDVTDGSNTGTISGGGSLQFNGTSNEVEVAVNSDTGAVTIGLPDDVTVGNNLTVAGNLTVQGTTTTVESTVTTLTDPVIELGTGSLAAGDGNDRGVAFSYGDGSAVQTGFFGYDMQEEVFTFKSTGASSSGDSQGVSSPFGAAKFGSLTLESSLSIANGGTGVTAVTANGVFVGNSAGNAIEFVTGTQGAILQFGAGGVPTASNVIDGGTF